MTLSYNNITSNGASIIREQRKPIGYHKRCHDCGQFLKKDLWVTKEHVWKKHALCSDCFNLYDSPEY